MNPDRASVATADVHQLLSETTEWKEIESRVIAALNVRHVRPCSACDGNRWIVQGFAHVPLHRVNGVSELMQQSLPCAAVVCDNCGNTRMINLFVLLREKQR